MQHGDRHPDHTAPTATNAAQYSGEANGLDAPDSSNISRALSYSTSPRHTQITVRFTFSLGIFVRMIVTVKTAKGAFATDLVPAPGAQL